MDQQIWLMMVEKAHRICDGLHFNENWKDEERQKGDMRVVGAMRELRKQGSIKRLGRHLVEAILSICDYGRVLDGVQVYTIKEFIGLLYDHPNLTVEKIEKKIHELNEIDVDVESPYRKKAGDWLRLHMSKNWRGEW